MGKIDKLGLITLLTASQLPAEVVGFDLGLDVYGGTRSYSPNTPNSVKSIDVVASDNSTVRVNCPDSKSYTEGIYGLRVYTGYRGETALESFRIGIEPLSWYHYSGEEVPSAKGVKTDKHYVASTDWNLPWGSSPKAGVYCDPKIKNILFAEKDLVWLRAGDVQFSFNLIGKLDYYDIAWNSFAARYPAGDEWFSNLDSLITSTHEIERKRGVAERIGLGLRMYDDSSRVSGIDMTNLFCGGLDISYGNILRQTDVVNPELELKLYLGLRF